MHRKTGFLVLALLLLLALAVNGVNAQSGYDPTTQTPFLIQKEAETVYLTNLARRDHGLPPLRWNYELTQAARWFSWDTIEVETNPAEACDHQDTQGTWPIDRDILFGYPGQTGAENAWCNYMEPAPAVEGWLNSAGHANNLLDENVREMGLGYYLRSSDGAGFITQDFGSDPAYPPVIINNEAWSTSSSRVNLFIYDRIQTVGFNGYSPAQSMQISNDVCFEGAVSEPYRSEKAWTLTNQTGWQSVYVRTSDAYGRTLSVSDSIYLGGNPPNVQVGPGLLSSTRQDVTLYRLDGGSLSHVQFSLGWLGDQFKDRVNNPLPQVNDPAAVDGRAVYLSPANGQDFTWDWNHSDTITEFAGLPMVAYFRIKASSNTSTAEIASLTVSAGANQYAPVSIKGTDFNAANQYQEFAVPFVFDPQGDFTDNRRFLKFKVQRSTSVDISVDMVTLFTAPQPLQGSTFTWNVPGGSYRGQGVWVRYSNASGGVFSPYFDGILAAPEMRVSGSAGIFLAGLSPDDPAPPVQVLDVQRVCGGSFTWQVSENAAWLTARAEGEQVQLSVDASRLQPGSYETVLTFTASDPAIAPVQTPVTLWVVPDLQVVYLPGLTR